MDRLFRFLFTHWPAFQNYVQRRMLETYNRGTASGERIGDLVGFRRGFRAGFDEGEQSGRRQAVTLTAEEQGTHDANLFYTGYLEGFNARRRKTQEGLDG